MELSSINWIGHASFRIEDAPGTIYIDPWKLTDHPPPASLILVTHPHFDHLSPDDIAKISTPHTRIVGPDSVALALNKKIIVVEPGTSTIVDPWSLEVLPAYNLGKEFHKRSEGWVGYIITLSDGRRVYHSGDTDVIDEMMDVKADVALLPCGGTYTMTAEEVVEAAQRFRPGVVVPMHWGDIVGNRGDAERVKRGYPSTVILEPVRGTTSP